MVLLLSHFWDSLCVRTFWPWTFSLCVVCSSLIISDIYCSSEGLCISLASMNFTIVFAFFADPKIDNILSFTCDRCCDWVCITSDLRRHSYSRHGGVWTNWALLLSWWRASFPTCSCSMCTSFRISWFFVQFAFTQDPPEAGALPQSCHCTEGRQPSVRQLLILLSMKTREVVSKNVTFPWHSKNVIHFCVWLFI